VLPSKRRLIFLGFALAALAACERKSEIKVYRVSKAPLEESVSPDENALPANAPSPPMPGGMAPTTSAGSIPTPPDWEPQPLSQMRQASFLVKGDNGALADISFVSLGAAAGSVLENVNRWLSQLGQLPISEQNLDQVAQRLTTALGDVTIVDLEGLPNGADPTKDGRIIAAMVTSGNSTLFFKMRGNAVLTEAQKPEFIKWVAAVCNSQTPNKSAQAAAMPAEASGAPQIKWTTPQTWTEVPPSSMRYASFTAPGDNGAKVDISIVTFAGEGGSDADNVNRWRQQLGLPPIDSAAVASQIAQLKSQPENFTMIDIAGASARTIAAWTRHDGRVWFFKATGPNAPVEKEKSNFVKFIRSVRFGS
jgi:hypothetical protein